MRRAAFKHVSPLATLLSLSLFIALVCGGFLYDNTPRTTAFANSGQYIFINKSGDDITADGTYLLPFLTIQAALNSANPQPNAPVTLIIGPGLYKENLVISDSHLTLIGAGPDATIIDGGRSGSVISLSNVQDVYVQDLTLLNGNALMGGAVFCRSAQEIRFHNLWLSNNKAMYGAGFYLKDVESTIIHNCLITENRCWYSTLPTAGSGIYCVANSSGSSRLHVNNCTIIGNRADYGAGICLRNCEGVTLTNNIISQNVIGGGVWLIGGQAPALRYNNIHGNSNCEVSPNLDLVFNDPTMHNLSLPVQLDDGPLGNHYLPVNSPLVDMGEPTFTGDSDYPLFGTATADNQPDTTPVDLGYHYRKVFYFISPDQQNFVISGYPANQYLGIIRDGKLEVTWRIRGTSSFFVDHNISVNAQNLDRSVEHGTEFFVYPPAHRSQQYANAIIENIKVFLTPRTGIIDPSFKTHAASSTDTRNHLFFWEANVQRRFDFDSGGEDDFMEYIHGRNPMNPLDDFGAIINNFYRAPQKIKSYHPSLLSQ